MDPSKDPRSHEGMFKYPYPGFWPDDRNTFHFEDTQEGDYRHLVIGHSQVRDKWRVNLPGDLSFPMDWISYSGAKSGFLKGEIIKTLRNNIEPLRISAIIWQNSIEDTSIEQFAGYIKEIEHALTKYPQHKVGFPTCPMVPQQKDCWEKVGQLNELLREANIRMGNSPYNLHKALMNNKKGKGLRVTQGAWKEYNNNKGLGYHIDEKYWEKYVKTIKTFHLTGFKDSKASRRDPAPVDKVKHAFPRQVMKMAREKDVRDKLNNIKSQKRDQYGKVVMQDDLFALYENEKRDRKTAEEIRILQQERAEVLERIEKQLDKKEEDEMNRKEDLDKLEMELNARERDLAYRESELNREDEQVKERLREIGLLELRLKVKFEENKLRWEKAKKDKRKRKKLEKKEKERKEKERKEKERKEKKKKEKKKKVENEKEKED